MQQTIISMREIQRNYKRILQKAKEQKSPVFLGAYGKSQAVLMDIEAFEKLQNGKKRKSSMEEWKGLKREFDDLARQGRQGVNLSQLVRKDRRTH